MKLSHPFSAFATLLLTFTVAGGLRAAENPPKHLADARSLVSRLSLENTDYVHGASAVVWTAPVASHTDCSGFLDALFQHSYGFDEKANKRWLGSTRPSAALYHDGIEAGNGFTRVLHVNHIVPGDILGVKYLDGKSRTGHIMVVNSAPKRLPDQAPLVAGTQQWEIAVIDSAESGHGSTDTRYKKGADGKDHKGLGTGLLRLYAHADGTVAGFSWSPSKASKFMSPTEEHLSIGRLKAGFQP